MLKEELLLRFFTTGGAVPKGGGSPTHHRCQAYVCLNWNRSWNFHSRCNEYNWHNWNVNHPFRWSWFEQFLIFEHTIGLRSFNAIISADELIIHLELDGVICPRWSINNSDPEWRVARKWTVQWTIFRVEVDVHGSNKIITRLDHRPLKTLWYVQLNFEIPSSFLLLSLL